MKILALLPLASIKQCLRHSKGKFNTLWGSLSKKLIGRTIIMVILSGVILNLNAQHEFKPRPEVWNNLVYGRRFMDRILPAPVYSRLTCDTWGTYAVRPRDIHNGIKDPEWSYWGGKPVLGEDGKFHFFG